MNTTVLALVRALVERLDGEAVCDDCITQRLGLSIRQHANYKTLELAGIQGFERTFDQCALCGSKRKVIRKVRKQKR
ncbi:MAG: hypothetical protein GW757_10325 [Alphaproteobacteria bacterium]|nr:hypothetical protein [Alphaproteobacteria bacterium]